MFINGAKGQGGCTGRPSMDFLLEEPAQPAADDEMLMMSVASPARINDEEAAPARRRRSDPDSPGRRAAREDLAAVSAADDAQARAGDIQRAARSAVRACEPQLQAASQLEGTARIWALSAAFDTAKAIAVAELFGPLMDSYDYRRNATLKEEAIQSLSASLHKWHMDDPQAVSGHSAESVIVRAMNLADLSSEDDWSARRAASGRAVGWDLMLEGPGLGKEHPVSVKAYSNIGDRFNLRLLESDLGPDPRSGFLNGVRRIADEHLTHSKNILLMVGRPQLHEVHGSILDYKLRLIPTAPIAQAMSELESWQVTEETSVKNGKQNKSLSASLRLGEDGQLAEVKYLSSQGRFFLNFDSTKRPSRQVASIPVAHPEQLEALAKATHSAIESR